MTLRDVTRAVISLVENASGYPVLIQSGIKFMRVSVAQRSKRARSFCYGDS